MVFEVALFNGAALAMGIFGLAPLAAHQIAITIPSITFMVPVGIGLAATVRVGLAAGAGDAVAARRAGFTAMAHFVDGQWVVRRHEHGSPVGVFKRNVRRMW